MFEQLTLTHILRIENFGVIKNNNRVIVLMILRSIRVIRLTQQHH